MTDDQTPAEPVGDEVVQSEAVEVEAAEAQESTEGQEQSQPAENESESQDAPEDEDQISKSKARRERRKASRAKLKASEAEAVKMLEEAENRARLATEAAAKLPAPKLDDFENYEEYTAALSSYTMLQTLDGRTARELEEQAKAHNQKVEAIRQEKQREDALNWEAQVAEGNAKYPDFDQVARNPNLPITAKVAELVLESDVGADVAYFLGKNPKVAAELSTMAPIDMARAIGRIEAQVSAPKPKTATTAPPPISPIKGNGSMSAKNPDEMTQQEYRAWREAGGTY